MKPDNQSNEASMVNSTQWEDMQSFRKPIIAIGDPGQLEPVGDDPQLMLNADIVLTEIHRQAAESAIIQFATHVRNGGQIRRGIKGEVEICSPDRFWESLEWADVCLCGFNKTRVAVNSRIRQLRYPEAKYEPLIEGEIIVCLKNDQKLGVSNGELFTVERIHTENDWGWTCSLIDSEGETHHCVEVSNESFGVEKTDQRNWRMKGVIYADYGYCLSVHKFQGSEAEKVAVLSEQCKIWCPIRHAYTAITRASKELRYAI